jgi:DNA-binding LacI/PurR family transcriptional regulator
MGKRRISLKDIANELNLSVSTVSRALRNVGEVNPETRKAVMDLAMKWKYRPNPLALGLLKNRTNTIGVIIPEIENYYYSTVLRGMDQFAYEYGFRLISGYSNDKSSIEKELIDEFINSGIDGLLICPAHDTTDYSHLSELTEDKIPFVLFDRDIEDLAAPKVVTDNYNAIVKVIEHLIDRRKERIALITCLEPLSAGRHRYEAYLHAVKEYNLYNNRDYIIHGNLSITTTVEATKNLLKNDPPPDAIIAYNDTVAMVAMKVVKEHQFSIPGDIAIVGFNDDPFSSFLEPALTTIAQPAYLIGMNAFELLMKIMKEQTHSMNTKIMLECGLVVRDSS